jgi:hypothetical protein
MSIPKTTALRIRRAHSLQRLYEAVQLVRFNTGVLINSIEYDQAARGPYGDLIQAIHETNWNTLQELLEIAIAEHNSE